VSAPTEITLDTPTDHAHRPATLEAGGPGETAAASWAAFIGASLRPFLRRFSLLAALLLGGIALELAAPLLVRRFIDAATRGAGSFTLLPIALVALSLALANQAVAVASTFVGQDVGWATTNRLRERLARHLLRLDMRYHKAHLPGEFIERIDGDLTNLSNFFSILMIQVVGSGGLLLGTLVVLLLTDWRVGLALALYVAASFAILLRLRSVAIPAGVQERESSATFLGFLEERLAGVEDIRANGGGGYVMDQFYHSMRQWFTRTVDAWNRRSSIWTTTTLLFSLGVTLALGLSTLLYQRQAITLGTAYLFFQYTVLLQNPIERITQQLQEFQKAASSLIRVRGLLRLEPAIRGGVAALAEAEPGQRRALAVRFDHVTFAYEEDEAAVLHDVDFVLQPGTVLGLLGRTGSGKTSLSRLLFRLYDVTAGAVRLDGVDVRDLAPASLRQRVGVVTQDVQLFQATVRDNLTFFDPRVSDARILAVIAEMGLADWLARLPAGLDTPLESGGGGLSAGEAQLLAFVRVFLRDPGLVILDEPSSRLDLATERLIERGVSTLLRGRTGIIIAHRLATVRRADMIMTLGDGRVLEYGPRAALERDPSSRFYALLRVGLEELLA
jgi:ABC-type multidrug transport system fused ATPase/permease subunit